VRGVYIQDLYVAPDLRSTGLGKRILVGVLRTAYAGWRAEYLRLAVGESNMDGQGFYERLGMGLASGERISVIDGDDLASLRKKDDG
jgi:ribosomal protein S18 acetylase RimI-like enzyme